jgi:DNA primase
MPYIKRETIDKVFDTADLLEVVQDFVQLKKQGANWIGLSPFTDEKTGSFSVSVAKGMWKDFSSGKGGNSAVSFLMAKDFTYIDAITYVAKKYAIDIEYDDSAQAQKFQEQNEKKESLRPLLEATIIKYEESFRALPEDHPAKIEVYQKRQYTDDIVSQYRIGYAPGNKFIYDLCVANGKKADAIEIGLISETNDKWVDRVIYPLLEKKGNTLLPVGLAGRSLSTEKKYAKWLNSQESDLYKKETFWYGLDKGKEAIVKSGEAWIVEGYNDVIGWQIHGILNTIASSGTAISKKQMRILKKLCEKIVFCFDPDAPGKKAMLKYIPQFIEEGFRVQMVFLQPQLDPDDFVRHWDLANKKYDLTNAAAHRRFRKDGFQFLMTEKFKRKDEIEKAKEAQKLTELISIIPEDDPIKGIYIQWLAKESKVKLTEIKAWLKQIEQDKIKDIAVVFNEDDFYRIPDKVKIPLDQLRPIIERYQLFQANNQIWVQIGTHAPFDFISVSNFSIEIIQHMQDEKFPMKLVRVKNVHGLERIFDMQSADMNSPQAFENAVTAHGNFRWKGGRKEHELLKTYLFDGMGTGRKIDVLGWQAEGFWVWNNKVTLPNDDTIIIDENGVFKKGDVSYYVPSANDIYKQNIYKYEAQKKVISIEPSVTFNNYANQVIKVHREHGMMGILFSISSAFQDIVVGHLNFFPMLFLFGPASSGKDLLADCCQSFFGLPQTAINLEGGVSTIKAQVREFAQFCNTISQLSEYKPGDDKLDGVLKGLWDRRGYKRGNIDSHVGTESIPILSSVLMTGNYCPSQEALITRYIWNFMDKTTFTDSEIKEYEKLSDMTKKGISGFTDQFLKHRESVKNNFKYKFREFKATLGQRHEEANSRMIANLSVLGTFYQMFKDVVSFPFTHTEMMEHFDKTIALQMNKMDSASTINRWWDCFLSSMRGTLADQIRHGRDFKLEGDRLYFNFTSCYNRVSRQWYVQYRDASPAKGVMMDSLKKDKSFIDTVAAVRFAAGKDSKSTSAYVVNLNEIPIADEIKFAIDFQKDENSLFAPATPIEKINNKDEQEDLPF